MHTPSKNDIMSLEEGDDNRTRSIFCSFIQKLASCSPCLSFTTGSVPGAHGGTLSMATREFREENFGW